MTSTSLLSYSYSSLFPTSQAIKEAKDASLSTGTTSNGILEVHSTIPNGIEIGNGRFGRCLIATKHFPKGSLMYRGYAILAKTPPVESSGVWTTTTTTTPVTSDDEDATSVSSSVSTATPSVSSSESTPWSFHPPKNNEFLLHLYANNELTETCLLDDLNSVQDLVNPMENRRQVYGFDGFMNHSCAPNCYCPLVSRTSDLMSYDTVAVRDIFVGDEITCDYALFDYECDGHSIPQCGCHATNCRGQMLGFKALPMAEKVRIMKFCEQEIRERFFDEETDVVLLHSDLPQGVALMQEEDAASTSLIASRKFTAGEVLYTNQATIMTKNDELASKTYILKVEDHYMLMSIDDHCIHRPDYVEFIGFDSFQDHSCDPNTYQIYHDTTNYTVYAKTDILPGELITIDYGQLENHAEKILAIPSTTFPCKCGSVKCRGVIVA